MAPLGERFTKEEVQEFKKCIQEDMKNCHEDQSLFASVNHNGLEEVHNMRTPKYYESLDDSEITCLDAIAAMGAMEGYCKGNIVKYLWRDQRKSDDPMEDLIKAQIYMNKLVEYREVYKDRT